MRTCTTLGDNIPPVQTRILKWMLTYMGRMRVVMKVGGVVTRDIRFADDRAITGGNEEELLELQ